MYSLRMLQLKLPHTLGKGQKGEGGKGWIRDIGRSGGEEKEEEEEVKGRKRM